MPQNVKVIEGRVTAEGDDLYYEVRGHGRPLLMISGGAGDAGIYTFVANYLADEFKVITYDRRGQSRSTRHDPQNFEISQQSRDAAAVMDAAGEKSVIVFGSSSGAIFGFDLARSQPHRVQALIAHEPPALRVLPDADKWLGFLGGLYAEALTQDMQKARSAFFASIVVPATTPDPGLSPDVVQGINDRQQMTGSGEFFMRYELLPSVNYKPDVGALKKSGVKIVMAIGKVTLDAGAYYGRTVPILSEQLGCKMAVLPGHHMSYGFNPRDWTTALRNVLRGI